MLSFFVIVLWLLIALELIKGLSANGTPPVLQRFAWQMDLAYAMWSSIAIIRIVGAVVLLTGFFLVPVDAQLAAVLWAVPLLALWGGIYWLFNHYWVGRVKFPPIGQKVFASEQDNTLDLSLQVIGVERNGVAKAFPANMLYFHHQIPDEIDGHPIWVTYCGLCRSGRVYDLKVDGQTLTFSLIGAISYNATFRDTNTGSWWRQETGEAAKGPLRGRVLDDVGFEQMTLADWFAKHPDSTVLQYDPSFVGPYTFTHKLLSYEASKPAWHMVGDPPLVLGVVIDGEAHAYDWGQLKARGLVHDAVNGTDVLALTDPEQIAGFVYGRRVEGRCLNFERDGDGSLRDRETGSTWNHFGRCIKGELSGQAMPLIQSYQQYVRGWITFHPDTTFFDF